MLPGNLGFSCKPTDTDTGWLDEPWLLLEISFCFNSQLCIGHGLGSKFIRRAKYRGGWRYATATIPTIIIIIVRKQKLSYDSRISNYSEEHHQAATINYGQTGLNQPAA